MPRDIRHRSREASAALKSVWSRRWPATALAIVGAVVAGVLPHDASAGTYVVRTCGERGDNLASAFNIERLTVRMFARRGCNIAGKGKRGLYTGNLYRKGGRVRRGSEGRVVINAPQGASFVGLKWAGEVYRPDCRYEVQVYARGPRGVSTVARNFRPYERCQETKSVRISGRKKAVDYPFKTDASGRPIEATRIVQRIECEAKREKPFCSNRRPNYVVTYRAYVTVNDSTLPQARILPETPLARGEWVNGEQPLAYEASDNVGVQAVGVTGLEGDDRACDYRQVVPCPNGRGQVQVDTSRLGEGTQHLPLFAVDSASNTTSFAGPQPARIDRTAPGVVAVALDGGEGWRSTNGFAARWTNPAENDRAPIVTAHYSLCPATGGECLRGERSGEGIAQLADLAVPTMGEWRLRVWRGDQAGNQQAENASLPVPLRYDGERPELGFEPISAEDPTRLAAPVTDKVSGLAGGQIEISREGSNNWQQLTTTTEGSRLVARLDDSRLEAGTYLARAFARDQAGNQGSTDRRLDGRPMLIRIPLRATTSLRAGVEAKRVRRGKRGRRRVSVLRDRVRVAFGRRASIVGVLASAGRGTLADADIDVYSRSEVSTERLLERIRTGPRGRFRYLLRPGSSRNLRFVYAGTAVALPSEAGVSVLVPAATTAGLSRRTLRNGGSVMFRGRLKAPTEGKLVELQVRLSGSWQTFRTTRTSRQGKWKVAYRFRRTCGLARYRFRARLPKEQGYPYETGRTRRLTVSVRGPACR